MYMLFQRKCKETTYRPHLHAGHLESEWVRNKILCDPLVSQGLSGSNLGRTLLYFLGISSKGPTKFRAPSEIQGGITALHS
jgi:hypothetical protein